MLNINNRNWALIAILHLINFWNPDPFSARRFLVQKYNILARVALRTAKDVDATDEEWMEFIAKLRKRAEIGRNRI